MSSTSDRSPAPDTSAGATDVASFLADLDGGQVERKLSIVLSKVAAAVVDHGKVGSVTFKFDFDQIEGTHQVKCKHTLAFARPTADGSASETESRSTVMHVGRFGQLSLAQPSLLERDKGRQGEIRG
jgi:hypothetical protein